MKNKVLILMVSVLSVFVMVGGANADNVRQFGSASSLTELQNAFNSIGATSIAAYGDQSVYAYYEPTGSGNVSAAYLATISFNLGSDSYEFGMYELGNTSNKLTLWSGGSMPNIGSSIAIVFDQGLNSVKAVNLSTLNVIDSTTWFGQFGFYAKATGYFDDTFFYSEDALNPLGYARFLTYESEGDAVTIGSKGTFNDIGHWYIAAEMGKYGDTAYNWNTTSADFSDFIVQMESIKPVPEPATMLLLGIGLFGIGLLRRKS